MLKFDEDGCFLPQKIKFIVKHEEDIIEIIKQPTKEGKEKAGVKS